METNDSNYTELFTILHELTIHNVNSNCEVWEPNSNIRTVELARIFISSYRASENREKQGNTKWYREDTVYKTMTKIVIFTLKINTVNELQPRPVLCFSVHLSVSCRS